MRQESTHRWGGGVTTNGRDSACCSASLPRRSRCEVRSVSRPRQVLMSRSDHGKRGLPHLMNGVQPQSCPHSIRAEGRGGAAPRPHLREKEGGPGARTWLRRPPSCPSPQSHLQGVQGSISHREVTLLHHLSDFTCRRRRGVRGRDGARAAPAPQPLFRRHLLASGHPRSRSSWTPLTGSRCRPRKGQGEPTPLLPRGGVVNGLSARLPPEQRPCVGASLLWAGFRLATRRPSPSGPLSYLPLQEGLRAVSPGARSGGQSRNPLCSETSGPSADFGKTRPPPPRAGAEAGAPCARSPRHCHGVLRRGGVGGRFPRASK